MRAGEGREGRGSPKPESRNQCITSTRCQVSAVRFDGVRVTSGRKRSASVKVCSWTVSSFGIMLFKSEQKGGSHMFKVRTVSRIAVFFLAMAVATTAVAAQKATPSGKVTLESTSIAAGIGVSWGDGKLTFKGKTYPFSIDGLSLVDWGISKAQANGDVYNLTDPAKLGGNLCGRGSWAYPGRRHGRHGAAQSGWRDLALAFCFSGRPAPTRHQRTDYQDEVMRVKSVEGRVGRRLSSYQLSVSGEQ